MIDNRHGRQTIQEYVEDTKQVVENLLVVRDPIDDEDQVVFLLHNIVDEFKDMVASIQGNILPTLIFSHRIINGKGCSIGF